MSRHDNAIPADFRPHVVVANKHKVYELGPDAVGQPAEDIFGDAVPASLRGCKRYVTENGLAIARLE